MEKDLLPTRVWDKKVRVLRRKFYCTYAQQSACDAIDVYEIPWPPRIAVYIHIEFVDGQNALSSTSV